MLSAHHAVLYTEVLRNVLNATILSVHTLLMHTVLTVVEDTTQAVVVTLFTATSVKVILMLAMHLTALSVILAITNYSKNLL